jgi:adenosylcobyric acid synthase
MKAISILGSSSDAGKSWIATAYCALLARNGYNVSPFKAQNMSNNAFVTLDGGEIGRAQAVQAMACGKEPIVEMNPILLKPSGDIRSQVILLGKVWQDSDARDYYSRFEYLWEQVRGVLDWWKNHCDVLILEGAGSPVELNLMERDLVNLRPIDYLDGRWILACDIERGGVFAQGIGTCMLMPEESRSRGLGLIANKFRGDITLFEGKPYFEKYQVPQFLGTLPMRYDLQPESEDSIIKPPRRGTESSRIAWIRFPRISNSQDMQPWFLDDGVQLEWACSPSDLEGVDFIVLPGSKNTIQDLQWLRDTGMADKICSSHKKGVRILGICGGLQMLGLSIQDPVGFDGKIEHVPGLGLLPVETIYSGKKEVRRVPISWLGESWDAYEIHVGRTHVMNDQDCEKIIGLDGNLIAYRRGNVLGTYLHGFMEPGSVRKYLSDWAGISNPKISEKSWKQHNQEVFDQMADVLEEYLDLDSFWRYLEN